MTRSKTAADFLIAVILTVILLVLRNLFTFFHKTSKFCCFSFTLLPILFELNTFHLYFFFRLSIPTIPYTQSTEIALVSLSNDFLPSLVIRQQVALVELLCSEAPSQLREFLTPETLIQSMLQPFEWKHVQVKLHVTLQPEPSIHHLILICTLPSFFFQKVFFHINIHLSRVVCFWL